MFNTSQLPSFDYPNNIKHPLSTFCEARFWHCSSNEFKGMSATMAICTRLPAS
jgi:hypothetical protein